MKKRVLVTGGAGFIGSHLCKKLLQEGAHVICLDNFYTGSRENIAPLLSHKDFSLLEQDVCQSFHVTVDEIYNLACPASPIHYQKDPVQTIRTSILGAINVLDLALSTKAKVLQASTSEVYGDPLVHPQRESYLGNVNPIGIRSCYDEGKRAAETLFFDYHRQYGVNIKIARIFNTFGPRMHPNDGRVVSNFIVQALQNINITIYGEGMQTRSFCYVEDLVEALMRLMSTEESITGPVNLGNPTEYRIIDLAKLVIAMTGSKASLVYLPLPQDDPKQRCPDITLAKTLLGWQPKTPPEEGLKKTIAYFESLATF